MREVYLCRGNTLKIEQKKPEPFLGAILEQARVIALVGAGGKTSLMYALAEFSSSQGRKTLVTTTTHIMCPKDGTFCQSVQDCETRWSQGNYAVWGEVTGEGKLTALSKADFDVALKKADRILVEADGAKRLSCKAPAHHEPQIPVQADFVIGVVGLSVLGRTIQESCFRPERVAELLNCDIDHRITPEDLAILLSSENGTRKSVGNRAYLAVLNQCDNAERLALGKKTIQLLSEKGVTAALTCFKKEGMNMASHKQMKNLIIVRGAGDLATGVIHRLHGAGFPVLALETAHPAAIRRQVAFSEAVYEKRAEVEGVTALRIETPSKAEIENVLERGAVPLLIDPEGKCIPVLEPAVLVDAILAKKNLGTHREMAPLTIALGPGFEAGVDVDFVVETCRGHNLGRIISSGSAKPNTGTPGVIAGYGAERVIHSPAEGTLHAVRAIGDFVRKGEVIAEIHATPVPATLDGLIRGLIRDGYPVTKGFKIADIDPRREEYDNCFTISDKARCIAGSVLELVCRAVIAK